MSSSTPGEILTSSQMSTVMRRVTKSLGGAAVKAMREAAYVGKARPVQSIDEVPQFNSDVKTPPVDLGQMRSSYKVDRVADGAILENVAPHAAHQEFGTRPFIAPMGVLQAWAERKVRMMLIRDGLPSLLIPARTVLKVSVPVRLRLTRFGSSRSSNMNSRNSSWVI